MQALCGATFHLPDSMSDNLAVLIANGTIVDIVPDDAIPADALVQNLGGGYLAAGFIDVQVNGGGGALFTASPDPPTLRRIAAAHRPFGTTGFLATVITAPLATRVAAQSAVAAGLREDIPGLLGIHYEGPHINPCRRGVHDPRWIAPPTKDDLAVLLERPGRGCVLVTLAPETLPPAVIRLLTSTGVVVAIGHSDATATECRAGLAAGARGFTHLFNAMRPLDHREPGVIGTALDDDASWCGVIADGQHVAPAILRLAWRAKARGKLLLVTDAMPPVGAEAGSTFALSGETIQVSNGTCRTADGRLAGSSLDMAQAVRNAVRLMGVPLDEALRMAAAWPADFLGQSRQRGRIAPGLAADLVLLSPSLSVRATWIAGAVLWHDTSLHMYVPPVQGTI